MVNVNDSGGNLHSHNQLDAELQKELQEALGDKSVEQLMDEAAAPPAPSEAAPAPDGAQAAEPRISHDMVRGRITAVRGDDVFVEISGLGGKNQGVVPLTQFDRPPRLGSIMDFVVQRLDEAEGLVILSREGAVTRATWEQLQRGAVVEARVVAQNKGGLELEMVGGIRAFMPASQVDMHHVDDLSAYVGQRVTAMVQDIDRKSKKVVISRRHFLEHERAVKQAKIWEQLAVGQTLDGKVTSIVEYGAFVDIGGADGLVHISDMSYSRLDKPGNLVTVGQDVKVKVLKLDQEKKRISLGMKQITPDPWEGIAGRIRAGEQISGRVLRLAEFGAFVEVLPGVEGLLPMSEMTWRRSAKANETVKEGDVIRLAVLTVDPEKRRLTLSLKQAGGDPWMGASHKYPRMALVDATVLSTTDFGAFVEIEPGVEGLVHISEMSDRRITAVTDIMKVGDKHQVRVLEVDEDNRRIRLSLKAVKEPPKEQAPAPATPAEVKQPAKPRKPGKALKGGMEHGALGLGLGQIKL